MNDYTRGTHCRILPKKAMHPHGGDCHPNLHALPAEQILPTSHGSDRQHTTAINTTSPTCGFTAEKAEKPHTKEGGMSIRQLRTAYIQPVSIALKYIGLRKYIFSHQAEACSRLISSKEKGKVIFSFLS